MTAGTRRLRWVLAAVGLVTTVWGVDHFTAASARREALAQQAQRLSAQSRLRAAALAGSIDRWRSDALFLAQIPPVQGMVRAAPQRRFRRVAGDARRGLEAAHGCDLLGICPRASGPAADPLHRRRRRRP
ncbi:MAG: hypothetical protein P4L83_14950 [Nevskia sp.]|nr:hypothetical protein [Nevskia sp.]